MGIEETGRWTMKSQVPPATGSSIIVRLLGFFMTGLL